MIPARGSKEDIKEDIYEGNQEMGTERLSDRQGTAV